MLCQATTCSQGGKEPPGYDHGSYAMLKAMPPGSNSMMRCVICKIRGVHIYVKFDMLYLCIYVHAYVYVNEGCFCPSIDFVCST